MKRRFVRFIVSYKFSQLRRNNIRQSCRGVHEKRCSENMQQIYRRTPMPKSDFNKVAERSHIPKQTCSFQVQVCLFMCDLLATLLKLHFDMGVLL